VSSDHPDQTHDFADFDSAQRYADDVASEADYEFVPPTAYIYDGHFRRVGTGVDRMPNRSQAENGPSWLRRLFGGR
jgi:hypothetical protein